MGKILVVEDNSSNLKLFTLVLEKAGFAVLSAQDAVSGIELAIQYLPQLILMDIQLPGMDGLTATRQLKANPITAHIPVVALTAFAMKGDEQRIVAAGCDGYIAKPIQYKKFLVEVTRFISASPI